MPNSKITILGGGVAGLAVAYYAQMQGVDHEIYDQAERGGGNAVTLNFENFYFDSGAHRFHDKDEEATRKSKKLWANTSAK
jgi:protoporphyrinogen oxidase